MDNWDCFSFNHWIFHYHYHHQSATASKTITIGSYGPDTEVWEHIAKMPETKKAGLT